MFCMKKMQWIAVMLMATSMGFAEDTDSTDVTVENNEVASQYESTAGEEETSSNTESEETVACASEESSTQETETPADATEVATTFKEDASSEELEEVSGPMSSEALSHIVNVQLMTDEDLVAAAEGNALLEFPVGSKLALQLFVDGDFLSLFGFSDDLGYLEVQETFYLGFPLDGGLVFSSDLIEWKPFLDFTTGDLSVFLAKEDENLILNIDLALNKRSA